MENSGGTGCRFSKYDKTIKAGDRSRGVVCRGRTYCSPPFQLLFGITVKLIFDFSFISALKMEEAYSIGFFKGKRGIFTALDNSGTE